MESFMIHLEAAQIYANLAARQLPTEQLAAEAAALAAPFGRAFGAAFGFGSSGTYIKTKGDDAKFDRSAFP